MPYKPWEESLFFPEIYTHFWKKSKIVISENQKIYSESLKFLTLKPEALNTCCALPVFSPDGRSCRLHLWFLKILLGISVSVSLSADMKKLISVFYRYRPIRKLSLSGFIGIGRYEKKLISRLLHWCLTNQK